MIQRVRYALLILVAAGTIFNLWTALDAISHIPAYDTLVNLGIAQAPTPNPIDVLRGKPADPVALFLARHKAETEFYAASDFAIWEHAAKVEFGIVVGGLALWLLFPRGKYLMRSKAQTTMSKSNTD
jgi:hypothetical protein